MSGPRDLPDPGFAGDDGSADAALVQALEADRAGTGSRTQVLVALLAARVLVPVAAVRAEEEAPEPGALGREKETDMAVVTLVGADGSRALPAFTSLASLAAWRPDARPVPVEATRAALSAVAEGAEVLVLDVGGPLRFDVVGPALEALARGRAWVPPHQDTVLADAVTAAVAAEPVVTAVRLGEGEGGSLRVLLTPAPLASAGGVRAAAAAIAARLSRDDVVRDRARAGLDLVVLPPPD